MNSTQASSIGSSTFATPASPMNLTHPYSKTATANHSPTTQNTTLVHHLLHLHLLLPQQQTFVFSSTFCLTDQDYTESRWLGLKPRHPRESIEPGCRVNVIAQHEGGRWRGKKHSWRGGPGGKRVGPLGLTWACCMAAFLLEQPLQTQPG
jgi:hypothetical protein